MRPVITVPVEPGEAQLAALRDFAVGRLHGQRRAVLEAAGLQQAALRLRCAGFNPRPPNCTDVPEHSLQAGAPASGSPCVKRAGESRVMSDNAAKLGRPQLGWHGLTSLIASGIPHLREGRRAGARSQPAAIRSACPPDATVIGGRDMGQMTALWALLYTRRCGLDGFRDLRRRATLCRYRG